MVLHSIANKKQTLSIQLDIGNNHTISSLSWYIIDENYKYVVAGSSEGYTYLMDMSEGNIISKFDKYGSGKHSFIYT